MCNQFSNHFDLLNIYTIQLLYQLGAFGIWCADDMQPSLQCQRAVAKGFGYASS